MRATDDGTIAIRAAAPADLPGILAIYNDAVATTTAVYTDRPRTAEAQAAWLEERRAQGLPVLVAAEGGAIAGFATYGPFRPWPGYRHTVEHSVYVAPGRHGRGVGSRLLAALVEAARAAGLHVMVAGVDAANEASLRLHERHGFERAGHLREVGRKFDRWLDLVLLQRLLDGPEPGGPGSGGAPPRGRAPPAPPQPSRR